MCATQTQAARTRMLLFASRQFASSSVHYRRAQSGRECVLPVSRNRVNNPVRCSSLERVKSATAGSCASQLLIGLQRSSSVAVGDEQSAPAGIAIIFGPQRAFARGNRTIFISRRQPLLVVSDKNVRLTIKSEQSRHRSQKLIVSKRKRRCGEIAAIVRVLRNNFLQPLEAHD